MSRLRYTLQQGQELKVPWYGGGQKRVRVLTDVALWHTPGEHPLAIRWVLIVDPEGHMPPGAFFSTDLVLAPAKIIEWLVLPWNVEVTFEEGRRHLGVETQRQWSEQAIAPTTPALFGLFSLVCVLASRLTALTALGARSTAWYRKEDVTFSDVLAFVRRALWAGKYFNKSPLREDQVILSANDWEILLDQLASTAEKAKVECYNRCWQREHGISS
jgi:hypothetical protein